MTIVGIDEVGRGCWAGPVVAGAIFLPEPIPGLRDSKKLSHRQRVVLSQKIKESSDFGIGWVGPDEVDDIGLTAAVSLAMQRALDQLVGAYDKVIIDGNYNFLPGVTHAETLIKADDLVPAVSAASIIAKVARDEYMYEQDAIYPGYGFMSHVGYGTAAHKLALARLGPCELHRHSYKPIKNLI